MKPWCSPGRALREAWGGSNDTKSALPSAHCKVTPALGTLQSNPNSYVYQVRGNSRKRDSTVEATLIWLSQAAHPTRRPTQPIIPFKVTHTTLAPKHIPGKERSPYISIPAGLWERGSHHHTSDSAGQHHQSRPPHVLGNLGSLLPEGDIIPVKDYAFSGNKELCPTSSYVSLHLTFFYDFFPLFALHCPWAGPISNHGFPSFMWSWFSGFRVDILLSFVASRWWLIFICVSTFQLSNP